MKTFLKNRRLLLLPATLLGCLLACQATAQTLTTLHSFTAALVGYTNSDGFNPYAGLVVSGDTLYGTAYGGGLSGGGTVFAIRTDGTGFGVLHSFNFTSGGNSPLGGLTLSSNTLYGATAYCTGSGGQGFGEIFAIRTNGAGFSVIYNWCNGYPKTVSGTLAALLISGNTLYGAGGSVFKVNNNGTAFADVFDFGGSIGDQAFGGLVLSANTFYGTCRSGGLPGGDGAGTMWKMSTDGSLFFLLHSFSTNSDDGFAPRATLILSSNTLYGTTSGAYVNAENAAHSGTVFKINTDGSGFAVLHRFSTQEGGGSFGSLILSGNTLFGVTHGAGMNPDGVNFSVGSGSGSVFAVNTDGTDFTNLYTFTPTSNGTNSDGAFPFGGLILSGNTVYGTTTQGGNAGNGTVFSITLPVTPPTLTITPAGTNVVLTWPTTPIGFTLQSTTNLGSNALWTTNFPSPVLVNGQSTVTNPVSGAHQFYRLVQ